MGTLEADLSRYFAQAEQGCGKQAELALHVAGEPVPADFAAHLATCAECQADLAALAQTDAQWASAGAEGPSASLGMNGGAAVPPVGPLPPGRLLRFPTRIRIFVAAIAAAVLAFVLIPKDDHRLSAKGGWMLEVAAERDGKQFLTPSGTVLQSGDSLGFFYSSDQDGYLTVLYADGHADPVRLFPARSQEAARVQAGSKVSLPDGAVLSSGSDCEWVIGLFSDRSITAGHAKEIASRMVANRHDCTLGSAADSSVDARVVTVRR